jgi:DNA-binding transcriptional ArsR family regulator
VKSSPADAVWSALADQTRRAALDLLRERETLTAGEIAASFPAISRPAVSKHLRVLRSAGLVRAEERGREWHYRLDAAPLGQLQREWLDRFAPFWQESLARLKAAAERDDSG